MTYLTLFNYNSTDIEYVPDYDFFNGTQMAKAAGKEIKHWLQLKSTKVQIEEKKVETGLDKLIYIKQGGNKEQGTWIHKSLLSYFEEWLSRTKRPINGNRKMEKHYRDDLAEQLGGNIEVPIVPGIIDILTPTEIIEVKDVKNWKDALGQILVYSIHYPSHQKRIHLFGNTDSSYLDMVKEHCSKFDVIVTWEV